MHHERFEHEILERIIFNQYTIMKITSFTYLMLGLTLPDVSKVSPGQRALQQLLKNGRYLISPG